MYGSSPLRRVESRQHSSYESCDSYETYESRSTAPTSTYTSTQASVKEAMLHPKFRPVYEDDVSPSTSSCPRSSVETFDSALESDEELTKDVDIDSYEDCPEIPPLPIYNHQVVDPNVVPASPQDFARLFPSRDRLSIRHDDLTPDGNLNLRVDTVAPGRRRQSVQLFHLRMYDLVKREFSLRRYCRDSGREVCSTERKFVKPASQSPSRPQATNVIKLEFSNYARVDISRHGGKNSKRYEFEWWGHRYQWKRIADKTLGSVSFHLVRSGSNVPVAHIVPETRSPTQVFADEEAGGWVPPCHMWISDQAVVDAATDVADVIMATGLVALADDCIKQRWQTRGCRKIHRFGLPLTTRTVDFECVGARSLMHNLFRRRASDAHAHAPRNGRMVPTY